MSAATRVARRGDEPPVIVELKLRFTLALVLQGIDRLAICERVYLAVPRPPRTARGLSPYRRGCAGCAAASGSDCCWSAGAAARRGHRGACAVPAAAARSARAADRRIHRRSGDANIGGRNRTPIVTAYREDALRCARLLAERAAAARRLRAATGVADAASILQRDVYGWFLRLGRGTYALSERGREALGQFAETVAMIAAAGLEPAAA